MVYDILQSPWYKPRNLPCILCLRILNFVGQNVRIRVLDTCVLCLSKCVFDLFFVATIHRVILEIFAEIFGLSGHNFLF